MKTKYNLEIQFNGVDVNSAAIEKGLKAYLKQGGHILSQFSVMNVYYLPATGEVHYNLTYAEAASGFLAGNVDIQSLIALV